MEGKETVDEFQKSFQKITWPMRFPIQWEVKVRPGHILTLLKTNQSV